MGMEAAEAVPAERVRRNGHLPGLSGTTKGLSPKVIFHDLLGQPHNQQLGCAFLNVHANFLLNTDTEEVLDRKRGGP